MLRSVRDDPFATIGELRGEVDRLVEGEETTWWQVFQVLRRRRLLTRRSRFQYCRRYR